MAAPTQRYRMRHDEATYLLRITEGGGLHPVAGNTIAGKDGTFPLPIPPQTLTPRQTTRAFVMQARDWAVSDEAGLNPPEWDLDGQFLMGLQLVNGARLDGWEVQRALEQLITYYADTNRKRGRGLITGAPQALLQLEFHDMYAQQSWVVIPNEVPLGNRSQGAPMVERYRLRLKGLRPTTRHRQGVDDVQGALDTDPTRNAADYLAAVVG